MKGFEVLEVDSLDLKFELLVKFELRFDVILVFCASFPFLVFLSLIDLFMIYKGVGLWLEDGVGFVGFILGFYVAVTDF